MTGREEERAAIVAFMMKQSEKAYHHHCTFRERLFWIKTALFWPENIFSGSWKGMADAIERGEHLKNKNTD